jgi:hypothetical protein
MTEPIERGTGDVIHQLREFLVALRLSPGRRRLALFIVATVYVVGLGESQRGAKTPRPNARIALVTECRS